MADSVRSLDLNLSPSLSRSLALSRSLSREPSNYGANKSIRRSVESDLQDLEAESINESLPEGFNVSEKIPSEPQPPAKRVTKHKVMFNFKILCTTALGAILGVLARLALIELTTYNGSYLGGVIWANFAACIIMGIAVESSRPWEILIESDYFVNKGSIPLYTGITTGFCGTFSSFSTVILEVFFKASDLEAGVYYHYPNHAYGIMEFLAVTLAQFGTSVVAFHVGKHFVEIFDKYLPRITIKAYKVIECATIYLGIISLIIVIVLCGTISRGDWRVWTFSCIFAPFGAWSRFYLSKYLNSRVQNFPMGTFAANISGTLILAILTLLSRGKVSKHGSNLIDNKLHCQVITGLGDGYCGALTTVSTFVVELFGLKTLHAYRYGAASISVAFAMAVLVVGSYNWTIGLTDAVC